MMLLEKGHNWPLPFNPCYLNAVRNTFCYGINSYVEEAESLTYDFHTWFKLIVFFPEQVGYKNMLKWGILNVFSN